MPKDADSRKGGRRRDGALEGSLASDEVLRLVHYVHADGLAPGRK